ncbi:hypothetical protein [Streptomyces griseofuscus]|uniref:hypothetical protein n=1 Tax=Streptomyces griseofuscus TaxID=146922 RepID=UPI0037F69351
MPIFGAVDFSQAACLFGYRVTVCDARPVFATADRFPYADEVVVDRHGSLLAVDHGGFSRKGAWTSHLPGGLDQHRRPARGDFSRCARTPTAPELRMQIQTG